LAKFFKKEAIALIPEPKRGDVHKIQVAGITDGTDFILSDKIVIIGKKPVKEELFLTINPKKWNLMWESEDPVTAQIKGNGYDELDSASIKMVGPDGDEISPYYCEVGGRFFKAKFYQKDGIAIIPEPKKGDKYEIEVKGIDGEGNAFCLNYSILIVGPKEE